MTLSRLAEQVTDIHSKVCEALQRKYSSVLSSDDQTSGLGQEVLKEFASIKPIFEQLEKVIVVVFLIVSPETTGQGSSLYSACSEVVLILRWSLRLQCNNLLMHQ